VRRRPPTLAALLATVALLASGCFLGKDKPGPDDAATAFLTGWSAGDVAAAAGATDDRAAATTGIRQLSTALAGARLTATLGAVTEQDEDHATAAYSARWQLPGVGTPWTYDGSLPLARTGDTWVVQWKAPDLHPKLTADGLSSIKMEHVLPERAALQDAAGAPLFARTAVVTVGVQPKSVTDLPALAARLAAALKIAAADVVADVTKAKPDAFVPVITLRRPDYEKVRAAIHELPGTVFQEGEQLLAPSRTFAQPLLGRVGPATAEVVKELGAGYTGGEVGTAGLQRALNGTLAGKPGARISTAAGVLADLPGQAGTAVRTTLDRPVQEAADAAVATVPQAASLVAIRPSTGAILAVADNTQAPFELGLGGRFPAGSTFKILTATALLQGKVVHPAAAVDCPATTVVYGKEFENEDKFDLGRIPLREAFAHSCNTTFTGLSRRLDPQALPDAAARYGVGTEWKLTASSFGGSVPRPKDDTEKAAEAIGQGRVEVSPLAMALVSAQVAKGGPVVPALIAGAPAAGEAPAGPPAAVLPALRDMMRAVVTDGTATALRDVPGGAVAGKTGTAEYGTAVPPRSHAWFTGYQGDLAFAVFVQDGQSSKTTAVPVARAFLTGLR
jgi:cell division protein FtsI/penicillin-binding protein 2